MTILSPLAALLWLAAFAACGAVGVCAAPASGAGPYTVEFLGTFGGMGTEPVAINDNGVVAGTLTGT